MSGERKWPYGGYVTQRAGRAQYPIIGSAVTSAGLLLYAYVYEARWAGLKTTELCPRWKDLSEMERQTWEERAAEIAELTHTGKRATQRRSPHNEALGCY